MNIVVKYARRDKTEKEVYRTKVMSVPNMGSIDQQAIQVIYAFPREPGERVVAIMEAGYH